MANTLLTIESLTAGYGEIQVLNNVDMSFETGSITVLMGPNGAGKSTLLKSIYNITDIKTGTIRYNGGDITGLPPYALLKHGIAFVSQGRLNFSTLNIRDNLLLGAHRVTDKDDVNKRIEALFDTFPVLRKKQKKYAFSLSGGEQQMLAIARALMSNPTLLLMDEPSLGLAPKLVKEVFEKIVEIKETYDTTIVIVEHNLKTLMKMADYGYILVQGEVVAHDRCDVLKESNVMKQVFVGTFD